MVLVPVLLAGQVQIWVFELARAIDGTGSDASKVSRGANKPPPHQVVEQQRFIVPDIGEVWTERWQVPAGVRITRVELERRGHYIEVDNGSSISCAFPARMCMCSGTAPWRRRTGACTGAAPTMRPPTRTGP